jgi:hypothetical protein
LTLLTAFMTIAHGTPDSHHVSIAFGEMERSIADLMRR